METVAKIFVDICMVAVIINIGWNVFKDSMADQNKPRVVTIPRINTPDDLAKLTHEHIEDASEVGLHRIIAHLALDQMRFRNATKRCPMGFTDCPLTPDHVAADTKDKLAFAGNSPVTTTNTKK